MTYLDMTWNKNSRQPSSHWPQLSTQRGTSSKVSSPARKSHPFRLMFYHSEASTQDIVLKPPFQTSWSMFGKDADLKSAETYEGSTICSAGEITSTGIYLALLPMRFSKFLKALPREIWPS